ncbi:MAG: GTP-binding protein [Promethearchaeota archaeon]
MANDDVSYRFKVVLIGDWGVGKTSLARNFVDQKFELDYLPTIGANVLVQEEVVEHGGREEKVALSIWDIAGQEEFQAMRPAYYAGARGALLVADLTRIDSFQNLVSWNDEFRQHCGGSDAPTIMLANKSDLEFYLDESFIEEVGKKLGVVKILKTSALKGDNVKEAFRLLAEKMLESALTD